VLWGSNFSKVGLNLNVFLNTIIFLNEGSSFDAMADSEIKQFTVEFFKNLKCELTWQEGVLVVRGVPRSFEDIFGKASPYFLSFEYHLPGTEYVLRGSPIFLAMAKYLEGSGKTTLLKIDFDVDPVKELEKLAELRNCRIENVAKKHKNNFFSRFTFVTTFHFLNEREQTVHEIYVHEGNVVEGDLSGYKVVEGEGKEASSKHLEKDYLVARENLKELLKGKTDEISLLLGGKLEQEIERIRTHYNSLLQELGGDINERIDKIKDLEIRIRAGESDPALKGRLERLRQGLVKMGDDDSKGRILKEQEYTIKDAMHKFSLNVDNKLVNTTVIYYPVFTFQLFLKGVGGAGRFIETSYDPLKKSLSSFVCESCSKEVKQVNLCFGGHISCDACLNKCGECLKSFCMKCLKRSCSACGKALCKDCVKLCLGCSGAVCNTHMRADCVNGEDRCVKCLRACMRCHGLASPKHFGESLDGSKVCLKCLAEERRSKVMKKLFDT